MHFMQDKTASQNAQDSCFYTWFFTPSPRQHRVRVQRKVDKRKLIDYRQYVSAGDERWIGLMQQKQQERKYTGMQDFMLDVDRIEHCAIAYHGADSKAKAPGNSTACPNWLLNVQMPLQIVCGCLQFCCHLQCKAGHPSA